MQQQQTLEKDGDGQRPFVGLSLNETLRQCIIAGWAKKADKLRSDFKVSGALPDLLSLLVDLSSEAELVTLQTKG